MSDGEEHDGEKDDDQPSAKHARIDDEGIIAKAALAYAVSVGDADDAPTTYQQANNSDDAEKWVVTMRAELKAHAKNGS